jgi:hypothetical protein
LRLIAYAQNGIRVDENSILTDIPTGLPKIDGFKSEATIKAPVVDENLSIWRITPEDRANYDKAFKFFDQE